MNTIGVFGVLDSGPPLDHDDDYTTLILLHGYSYTSHIFKRMLPEAHAANVRLVLLNRRDFPHSVPIDKDELACFSSDPSTPQALEALETYMRQRALELYDFIGDFVTREKIPAKGGILVAGWSFGTTFALALLAYAHTFPPKEVPIVPYIRQVIAYDPPFHSLGYDGPTESYSPLHDPALSPADRVQAFTSWVSGYYSHDAYPEVDTLCRAPLSHPPPTLSALSPADVDEIVHLPPGMPDGSDSLLMDHGIRSGLFRVTKDAAIYFPESRPADAHEGAEDWSRVVLRCVWCDQSPWSVPWGIVPFDSEMEDAKRRERRMREVKIQRFTKMNHFIHWDHPNRALQALLSDDDVV